MNLSKLNIKLLFVIQILLYNSVLSGGSTYSRFGIGDIVYCGDSRLYAMGSTGIAFADESLINGLNPAGLARINATRFSGAFEHCRFSSKDAISSGLYSFSRLLGISIAIPISIQNGIVISGEAAPYSSVDYSIISNDYDTILQSSRTQNIYGSGGLSRLSMGLSFSPIKALNLGFRLNYIYGRIRQYRNTSYQSSSYLQSRFDVSRYYSGVTYSIGLIYEDLKNLMNISILNGVSIGMTFTTKSKLSVDLEKTYFNIAHDGGDSIIIQHGKNTLPYNLGFGISYLYKEKYRVLSDIWLENWKNSHFYEDIHSEFRNAYRTSLGMEIIPSRNATSLLGKYYYRFGIGYYSTYYSFQGTGINESFIAMGLGIPVAPETRLNIGLQISTRGTTSNNLQKDTIFRISIAISGSELWFQRFEED